MIKSTELMIGDWVLVSGTPRRVKAITKKKTKKEEPRKKAGWKINTLLVPSVNPADMVKVESKWITGWFRVEKVSHRGDYNGTNWGSAMELIEVENAKQDANQ